MAVVTLPKRARKPAGGHPATGLGPLYRAWDGLGTVLANALLWAVLAAYLLPMVFMFTTSIKEDAQLLSGVAPIWPASTVKYEYEGKTVLVYKVPTADGVHEWALVKKGRRASQFIDPAYPEQGPIDWDGSWRTLIPVYRPHFSLENFVELWRQADFLKLAGNTLAILATAGVGSVVASVLVAYGFARFPVPGGRWLFILLIGSILLPEKVTLIPTYIMFVSVLHWSGTWLPLIVPHLFGSAVMIFLLRQNFKSIPKDIEEAAVLDGAGPLRILLSIMLPQAVPTLVTVCLLQFFYFWNETRSASLYLGTSPHLYPVAFWLRQYGGFFPSTNLLQASALMVMIVPAVVLFLAQRLFMQGVVITGAEK
jgi:multiple sugar transport system permease protein